MCMLSIVPHKVVIHLELNPSFVYICPILVCSNMHPWSITTCQELQKISGR